MLNTVDHGPNLSNSFLLLLDGVEHDHRVEGLGIWGQKCTPKYPSKSPDIKFWVVKGIMF